MAYEKKDTYPLIKKPGIYPEKTIKELGLDNDDLEKFSLGHWRSIHRSNRTFVNKNQINTFSETVNEIEEENTLEIRLVSPFNPSTEEGERRLTAYRFFMQVYTDTDNGSEILNSNGGSNPPAGEIFPTITSYADFVSDNEGNVGNQPNYTGDTGNPEPSNQASANNVYIPDEDDYQNVLQFMREKQQDLYDFLKEAPVFVEQNTLSDENKILYGLSPFVNVNDLNGAEVTTTPTNPLKFSFTESRQLELDTILNDFIEVSINYRGANNEITEFPQDVKIRLSIMFDMPTLFFNGDEHTAPLQGIDDQGGQYSRGTAEPYLIPRYQLTDEILARESDFFLANIVSRPDAEEMYDEIEQGSTDPGEFIFERPVIAIYDRDVNGFYQAIIPNLLQTDFSLDAVAHDNDEGIARKAYWEDNLGWPNFNPEELEEYEEYLGEEALELQLQQFREALDIAYTGFISTYEPEIPDIDYAVSCFYSKPSRNDDKILKQEFLDNHQNEHFLYYDFTENPQEYEATSYPIQLNLIVDLLDFPDFINEIRLTSIDRYMPILPDTGQRQFGNNIIEEDIIEAARHPQECVYRYEVISWGDEDTPIDDEKIKNSFYFSVYDSEEFPDIDSYENKKRISSQTNLSKLIIEREEIEGEADNRLYNISSHIYTTPGLKAIKLIIYRYTPNGLFLISSTLITKNININDGLLKAQDFSIFGGTGFNFLPITENQAIIGGFDVESKYNNSVSKIVKDDNFTKDDYLEKSSAKNYIEKINDGSLGKQPGQLDLGQVRVFKETRDIYDFIGGNKLNWIVSGSDTLPVNSLATDIFIRDNKCVVDLIPSDTEYSAIQNKAGSKELGVLIGDYKVDQPQDGRVQKQGSMQTPILDTDNEKQAF